MARNQDSPGARARLACSRPARRLPGSPPIGGRLSAVWPGAPPAGPRAAALPVLSWGQISRPSGSVQPSAGPQRPRKPGKSLPPTHAPKRGALSACPSAASPPCPLPSPSPPLGGRGRRRADLAAAANGRQRPEPCKPRCKLASPYQGRRAAHPMMPQPVKGCASWAARRPTLDRPGRQQVRRAAAP